MVNFNTSFMVLTVATLVILLVTDLLLEKRCTILPLLEPVKQGLHMIMFIIGVLDSTMNSMEVDLYRNLIGQTLLFHKWGIKDALPQV